MAKLSAEFSTIVSIININLRWIGIEFRDSNCDRNILRGRGLRTLVVVAGGALYAVFLLHCMFEANHLTTTSQIMFLIPWMIQYTLKSGSLFVQSQVAVDFIRWAKDTLDTVQSNCIVNEISLTVNKECLRVAKMFCW